MNDSELPFDLPIVGLGTWQMWGPTASRTVGCAIELGYRHIDTATGYGNEEAVGAGIRDSGVAPDEIVITTKFPEEEAGRERELLQRSLDCLGVAVLDLWLIHGPAPDGGSPAIWDRFIEAREQGLVRAIGVSNFSAGQVDELIAISGVTPAVNQVAFGPRYFDPHLVRHHAERGVTLVGHSPLSENDPTHPVLRTVADRYGRSVAQVILRWHWEHRVPTVAKSVSRDRLAANLKIQDFSLEPAEVAAIDRLGLAGPTPPPGR